MTCCYSNSWRAMDPRRPTGEPAAQPVDRLRGGALGGLPDIVVRELRQLRRCFGRISTPTPKWVEAKRTAPTHVSCYRFCRVVVGTTVVSEILAAISVPPDPPVNCGTPAGILLTVVSQRQDLAHTSRPSHAPNAKALGHKANHPVANFGTGTNPGLTCAERQHTAIDARRVPTIVCKDISPNPAHRLTPSKRARSHSSAS
jgi:hypothetical protein